MIFFILLILTHFVHVKLTVQIIIIITLFINVIIYIMFLAIFILSLIINLFLFILAVSNITFKNILYQCWCIFRDYVPVRPCLSTC